MSWADFVLTHGTMARKHLLAHILGVSEQDIETVRATGAGGGRQASKSYAELFSLWHGRAPEGEGDWPAPRLSGRDSYEWFVPELTLLATLVGQMSVAQIAATLTARLRKVTGDKSAVRSRNAVLGKINRLGLQTGDLVGGLTVQQAGAEIGSEAMVYQAISNGALSPARIGKRHVIPREQWEAWKAARVAVPPGYVQLASLRQPLGIKSDKLPEFAKMGYIPTAIRCNPMGSNVHSTKFGTWYVAPEIARQLVADRHAGRAMPWHGKPLGDNLRVTWRLFEQRRHPASCETCAEIWGRAGAPTAFDDYLKRYPPLAHGAKRHLTMTWHPGWTVPQLAREAGVSVSHVRRAIASGALAARTHDGKTYITRTDATRWRTRKCPTGDAPRSWITLASAKSLYGFKVGELRALVTSGKLKSKKGSGAGARGQVVVCRQQCAQLRERQGFTEAQAAKRVGVSIVRFRELLKGVAWRAAPRIPLVTVQAVGKRLESQQGMTVPDAAKHLRRTEQWVNERIEDGTVRVTRARWDARRLYLTAPMIERLRGWKKPAKRTLTGHWLPLGEAAKLAGVSTAGLHTWSTTGSLKRRKTKDGYRYHRFTVQARARRYWSTTRRTRARPPAWFVAEQRA